LFDFFSLATLTLTSPRVFGFGGYKSLGVEACIYLLKKAVLLHLRKYIFTND